jgi:thiamine biosynthesis lipoprotein
VTTGTRSTMTTSAKPKTPDARLARALVALALATLSWLGCAAAPSIVFVEDGQIVMGTVLDLSLEVEKRDEERAREALAAAFGATASLESVASRFIETSDVSRLDAAAGQGTIEIDPRVYALLARAEEQRVATGGAFDVSVGPVVELWIRAAKRGSVPSDAEIAAARSLVGKPLLLESPNRAGLAKQGMSIDLGGIAKGFALDRVAADLRRAGFANGLLSFGQSSVWALGRPSGAQAWRLGVRSDEGEFAGIVELSNQALSLSSSLGQWSDIEGRRYGHVVDPRSGLALSKGRRALVVATDAARAEALSTALLLLSEEQGRAILGAGAEAWVVDDQGHAWETPGWQAATRFSSH